MFSITDNERLRDAYALLMFMQSDIPPLPKGAAVKNLAATVKMEVRAYNNRPALMCISFNCCPTMTAVWNLFSCPISWTRRTEMDATNWFLNHHYLKSYNSPYDCTGQEFTNWFYLFRRRGHWFAYHRLAETFEEEVQ